MKIFVHLILSLILSIILIINIIINFKLLVLNVMPYGDLHQKIIDEVRKKDDPLGFVLSVVRYYEFFRFRTVVQPAQWKELGIQQEMLPTDDWTANVNVEDAAAKIWRVKKII